MPTTILSNDPHYPVTRDRILDVDLLADLLRGVEECGVAETSAVILTCFLGSPANGAMVAGFVVTVKRRNPDLIFILDPVPDDDDIGAIACPELIDVVCNNLMTLADIANPNRWKLRQLTASSKHDNDLSLVR